MLKNIAYQNYSHNPNFIKQTETEIKIDIKKLPDYLKNAIKKNVDQLGTQKYLISGNQTRKNYIEFLTNLLYRLDDYEVFTSTRYLIYKPTQVYLRLNFVDTMGITYYSFEFSAENFEKSLENPFNNFSDLKMAPYMAIETIREQYVPLDFDKIEEGCSIDQDKFLNNYFDQEKRIWSYFTIPITELIKLELLKEGMEKGSKPSVTIKKNFSTNKLEIEFTFHDFQFGNRRKYYTYSGYLDLRLFTIKIEKLEVDK